MAGVDPKRPAVVGLNMVRTETKRLLLIGGLERSDLALLCDDRPDAVRFFSADRDSRSV